MIASDGASERALDVLEAAASPDGDENLGAIERPARDTLDDIDAEPDWPALYHHLGGPDSMCVSGIWLTATHVVGGDPFHRFSAEVRATYDAGLGRAMTAAERLVEKAVDRAWPEAEFRYAVVDGGTLRFAVIIEVPFDRRHLDWMWPSGPLDQRVEEYTVGLLPENAKDDIACEAVSVERVKGIVQQFAGEVRLSLEPVTFYLGGITESRVVDRIGIGERAHASGDISTYTTAELDSPRDAANIDKLEASGIEVTIS